MDHDYDAWDINCGKCKSIFSAYRFDRIRLDWGGDYIGPAFVCPVCKEINSTKKAIKYYPSTVTKVRSFLGNCFTVAIVLFTCWVLYLIVNLILL